MGINGKFIKVFFIHFLFVLFFVLLFSGTVFAGEVRVAVASNFKPVLQKISVDFQRATGYNLKISSGSSGKLFAQIKHGAPFDVFLSADERLPNLLIKDRIASSESAYVYALGKLVFISNIVASDVCKDVLSSNQLRHLAIANPKIAPYGLAAKQVLQKLSFWQHVQPRIVMGENIAQTFKFVFTKNADAGFVAQSILNMAKTTDMACVWHVPMDMYAPIKQQMVLLNRAEHKAAAQKFMQYMRSAAAKKIIEASGYDVL